ncbi:hypothetical protein DFH27DRAFT_617212 [Peziza echinospora]|nr:hypothetical protein DFH27DRAFT_617212 [Peziza echinospora]
MRRRALHYKLTIAARVLRQCRAKIEVAEMVARGDGPFEVFAAFVPLVYNKGLMVAIEGTETDGPGIHSLGQLPLRRGSENDPKQAQFPQWGSTG